MKDRPSASHVSLAVLLQYCVEPDARVVDQLTRFDAVRFARRKVFGR
jgi:hypothetical protein